MFDMLKDLFKKDVVKPDVYFDLYQELRGKFHWSLRNVATNVVIVTSDGFDTKDEAVAHITTTKIDVGIVAETKDRS